MPKDQLPVDLTLQIDGGDDLDQEELDRLTRSLKEELLETDVEDVQLAKTEAPPGAKAVLEAAAIGSLIASILPTALPKLIDFLQAWTLRGENRTIKIKTQDGDRSVEIDFSPKDMSPEQLDKMLRTMDKFLNKK